MIGNSVKLDIFNQVAPEVTGLDGFVIYLAAIAVVITLMCQIRSFSSAPTNQEVDKLPSFAFYRKRFLSRYEIRSAVAALSVMLSISSVPDQVLVESGPDYLVNLTARVIQSMQGKFFSLPGKLHNKNYLAWLTPSV